MENKKQIPVAGETYHYFDDGKIRKSRRHDVTITEVIPFDKVDKETLEDWQSEILIPWKLEVERCDWLYAKETDYFIKGILHPQSKKYNPREVIFVRMVDGGWFSLGWFAGWLDVDGELNKTII